MGIEFLVKANDNHRICKKGFASGRLMKSPGFFGKGGGLPNYVIVKVTNGTLKDVEFIKEPIMVTFNVIDQGFGQVKIEAANKTALGKNEIVPEEVAGAVKSLGVATTINSASDVVFDKGEVAIPEIERVLIDRFKRTYSYRRYRFSHSLIDAAIKADNSVIELTKAEFLNSVTDLMEE